MIHRITSRETFLHLRKHGIKFRSDCITVIFTSLDCNHPKVGFAFTRKFGSAVARNRAKRRLRAAFAECDKTLTIPSGAYLVFASPRILDIPFENLLIQTTACIKEIKQR